MGESREYMVKIIKDRGFRSLKVKIGSPLHSKYGTNCPVDKCPEYQIRAIYLSGKHYSSPVKKAKNQGQLEFNF